MKTVLYVLVLLSMITLFSCSQSTDVENSIPKNYLPLEIGNYWLYDRVALDENNMPSNIVYHDSLVVIDSKVINGKISYQIAMFREGLELETGYVSLTDANINIYNKGLMPFLNVNSKDCWTKLPERWFSILPYDKIKWHNIDTILLDYDPFIITKIYYIFKIDGKRLPNEIYHNDSLILNTININYSGDRISKLKDTSIAFNKLPGYKYLDNDRIMIMNEYSLTISFAENIGICKMIELFINGPDTSRSLYELKRYKLN